MKGFLSSNDIPNPFSKEAWEATPADTFHSFGRLRSNLEDTEAEQAQDRNNRDGATRAWQEGQGRHVFSGDVQEAAQEYRNGEISWERFVTKLETLARVAGEEL